MNRWLHERMGLNDTFHSLRHWFGTQLYRSSRDLRLVQDLMAAFVAADDSGVRGLLASRCEVLAGWLGSDAFLWVEPDP